MKNQRSYLRNVVSLLLAVLILTACSAPAAEPDSAPAAPASEVAFFSVLTNFQEEYGFGVLESVDLGEIDAFLAGKDGFQWQGPAGELGTLEDVDLKQGDGLAIEFSFALLPDAADAGWAFELAPLTGGSSVLRFAVDGLSAQADGQPQSTAAFEQSPDWQPGAHYMAFLHLNANSGLDLRLWETDQPNQVYTAALMDVYTGPVNLAIESGTAQSLVVYRLWKLENTVSAKAQAQISYDTFAAALADYQIETATAVDEMVCDDQAVGTDGVFTWNAMTNAHCDLSLQMGQALAFNFVLANPADEWARIAIVKLDANLEVSDMPVKNLGLTLANDKAIIKQDYEELGSYAYMDGFELEAGITYSVLILMNEQNGFEIQIWPADNPDVHMSVVLDSSNVPPDWLPVENEEWVFGIWLPEEQQLTLSNLSRFTLGAAAQESTQTDGGVSEEGSVGLESWQETGVIPNLGDFYIADLSAYDNLTCNDTVFASNAIDLPAQGDQITNECQIDLPNEGQGWITEFTFQGGNTSEDVPHFVDFAFINREGDHQHLLRYTPHFNDVNIKLDDQYLDAITLEGDLDWVAGKSYTLVFISQYDKYFFVWPSDDPSNKAKLVISDDRLRESFGDFQPDALWQLRIWQGSSVDLKLENMYHFSAN